MILSLLQQITAFEQHPRTCQGARIDFAASNKHFDGCPFGIAEVDRSGSFHENFPRFSSAYHKIQTGLSTS